MRIRKATKRDILKLIMIVKGVKSIEDYPGEYNKLLFEGILKDKDTILLVAEIDKEIVGFEEIKIDRKAKRIYGESLAVSKKFRGKGVGKQLFSKLEGYAKKYNIKRISLLVREWNIPMNKLAKSNNYKISDKFNFWEKK
ncbi:MAG: GNAT family N-acetyltransferase [Nanoarchaeota archaeon]